MTSEMYPRRRAPEIEDAFWAVQRLTTDLLPKAKYDPRVVEESFRALVKWPGGLERERFYPPPALVKFLKTYNNCVMRLHWPPKFYLRIRYVERADCCEPPECLIPFVKDLNVYWYLPLGKATTLFGENGLGNAVKLDMELFFLSDCGVYGYNDHTGCVYTLCDEIDELQETGLRFAHMYYVTDYTPDLYELENAVYSHYILPGGVFDNLLTHNPERDSARQFVKTHAGHMLANNVNDHLFVIGDEKSLGLQSAVPQKALDRIRELGFFFVGITSQMEVKIVTMHDKMRGVFHWTAYDRMTLVAEDIRSYTRMHCPTLISCIMRTYHGDFDGKKSMRLGKNFPVKSGIRHDLPDDRFFAAEGGGR